MAKGEKSRLVGNIEWRGPGKCRLTVSGGFDPSGKRIRKRKTVKARNDRDAEKQLAAFIAELEGGSFADPTKMKFSEFVDKWMEKHAKRKLKRKTYHGYKELLEKRIVPALGHARIDQIKPLHILEYEDSLRQDGARWDGKEGGLSEKTILQHHAILSSVFNTAVKWKIIKENPISGVDAPTVKKKEIPAYDEEQTAAMLDALRKEPLKYQVLVHLALVTGLRRGELMGLEWSDIDFDRGILDVSRTSQYTPEEGTFDDDTKTEESDRLVSLPVETLEILILYAQEQEKQAERVGDLWQGSNRLFTTWDGRPMFPATPTQWFPDFLERHKLPHINFHGLRHTSATLLIHSGANIKAVSSRLGHAKIGTTIDIYTKALRSADRACADTMSGILKKAKKEEDNGPGVPKTVPKSNIVPFVNKREAR
jgi:integrase